ncbi:MAG: hypothetical protein ACFB9N_17040 [Geitlerinemataceae cyanobacterium]
MLESSRFYPDYFLSLATIRVFPSDLREVLIENDRNRDIFQAFSRILTDEKPGKSSSIRRNTGIKVRRSFRKRRGKQNRKSQSFQCFFWKVKFWQNREFGRFPRWQISTYDSRACRSGPPRSIDTDRSTGSLGPLPAKFDTSPNFFSDAFLLMAQT